MLGHTALIRFVLRENFMFLILLLFDRSYNCSAFCNFIHLILFLEFHGSGLNTVSFLAIPNIRI